VSAELRGRAKAPHTNGNVSHAFWSSGGDGRMREWTWTGKWLIECPGGLVVGLVRVDVKSRTALLR
jgi:hypothetical protein